MVPADFREWWLAAAALTTATGDAQAQQPERAAVVAGSQGETRGFGVPGLPGERVIYLGDPAYRFERLRSSADGITHLLFLDQSSLTLAPNTEIVLDEFVYDPPSGTGKISVRLAVGLLRIVGGVISKRTETTVTTPFLSYNVRGGISIIEAGSDRSRGTFLFGQSMRTSSPDGSSQQTVTRPGFSVSADAGGQSAPARIRSAELGALRAQFEGRAQGQAQGPRQPPGAPPGQLLSTSDRPGATGAPDRLIADDRVGNQNKLGDDAAAARALERDRATGAADTLRNLLVTTTKTSS